MCIVIFAVKFVNDIWSIRIIISFIISFASALLTNTFKIIIFKQQMIYLLFIQSITKLLQYTLHVIFT